MAGLITVVSKTNLGRETSHTKSITMPNRLFFALMYLSNSDTAKQTRQSKETLWKMLIQVQLQKQSWNDCIGAVCICRRKMWWEDKTLKCWILSLPPVSHVALWGFFSITAFPPISLQNFLRRFMSVSNVYSVTITDSSFRKLRAEFVVSCVHANVLQCLLPLPYYYLYPVLISWFLLLFGGTSERSHFQSTRRVLRLPMSSVTYRYWFSSGSKQKQRSSFKQAVLCFV